MSASFYYTKNVVAQFKPLSSPRSKRKMTAHVLNWISETGLSMNEVEQLKKEIEELKQIIESKNNQVESKNRHIKRLEGIISNMKKQAQDSCSTVDLVR